MTSIWPILLEKVAAFSPVFRATHAARSETLARPLAIGASLWTKRSGRLMNLAGEQDKEVSLFPPSARSVSRGARRRVSGRIAIVAADELDLTSARNRAKFNAPGEKPRREKNFVQRSPYSGQISMTHRSRGLALGFCAFSRDDDSRNCGGGLCTCSIRLRRSSRFFWTRVARARAYRDRPRNVRSSYRCILFSPMHRWRASRRGVVGVSKTSATDWSYFDDASLELIGHGRVKCRNYSRNAYSANVSRSRAPSSARTRMKNPRINTNEDIVACSCGSFQS